MRLLTKYIIGTSTYFISIAIFAGEQYIINHTKFDVSIEYQACHTHCIYNKFNLRYDCKPELCDSVAQLAIAAMTKIKSPFPLVAVPPKQPIDSFDYDHYYLKGISTPTGQFARVDFQSWMNDCNTTSGEPESCKDAITLNLVFGPSQLAGGAWIIDDYDLGFVTITYKNAGASLRIIGI